MKYTVLIFIKYNESVKDLVNRILYQTIFKIILLCPRELGGLSDNKN